MGTTDTTVSQEILGYYHVLLFQSAGSRELIDALPSPLISIGITQALFIFFVLKVLMLFLALAVSFFLSLPTNKMLI